MQYRCNGTSSRDESPRLWRTGLRRGYINRRNDADEDSLLGHCSWPVVHLPRFTKIWSGHGECIGQCLIWWLLSYEIRGSILVSGITDLIKSEPRYCNPSDMWFWYKCISSASQFGLYIVLHNSREAASSAVTLIYSLTDFSCSTRFSFYDRYLRRIMQLSTFRVGSSRSIYRWSIENIWIGDSIKKDFNIQVLLIRMGLDVGRLYQKFVHRITDTLVQNMPLVI